MSTRPFPDLSTKAVRAGRNPDPSTGAILTPITQSTTYVQQAVGVHHGHTYSRASNPTVSALETCLGALEDAPPSVCFSSGLAAETALFLALLRAQDHIVVSDVVYGGTVRVLRELFADLGVQSTFVDAGDPANIRRAIRATTRLIFLESPGNPTLKLTDIAAVAAIAREADIPLAVDNTFLTPVLQRPLDLGATISLYSTTKYIEGHNATIGGAITTRDASLLERLRFVRKSVGSIQSPFEAWLTLQGLKTLPLRIRRHSDSALEIAEWLASHPAVTRVLYPGLRSHPQHDLAQRQHAENRHSGIVSFEVRGGVESGIAVMNSVKLCSLAENLGAAETLITHPASMTHSDVPREQRESIGLTDGLIRLSVGLESPADIIADLDQALAPLTRAASPAVATRATTPAKTLAHS